MDSATAAATTTTKPAPAPRPAAFSFPALPQRMHAPIVAFLSPRSQASLAAAMNSNDNKEKAAGNEDATAPPTVAGGIERAN